MAIGTQLTISGAIFLAKAIGGKQLVFTRGAFGNAMRNGSRVDPTSAQVANYTKLINERMSLPIASTKMQPNGDLLVTLQVKNDSVKTDFKVVEVGLFAKDPDTGEEKLYCYAHLGDKSDYMHAATSDVVLEFSYELTTTIGTATTVYAIIDKSTVGVTLEQFEEHVYSTSPHPNWRVESLVSAGRGLSRSGDTLNVNVANETLLGGVKVGKGLYMTNDTLNSDSERLDSRLRQLEINQSNLYMKLEAANQLGVWANLLLVEDFDKKSCCDLSSVKVKMANAGADAVYLESFGGLVMGRDVTFVGRGNDQEVHLRGATYDGVNDSVIAYLSERLETAHTGSTVYRSTATIKDKKAYGPGEAREISRRCMTHSWKGEGSSTTQTATLETTPENTSKFILSGDFSFTSAGYFTLG